MARFPSDTADTIGIWDPESSDGLVETRLNVRLQSIIRTDGVTEDGQGELMALYEERLFMMKKHIIWRSLPGLLRCYGCKQSTGLR